MQAHQVVSADFDDFGEVEHVVRAPAERFHGVAAGVEPDAVGGQAADPLADAFGHRALRLLAENVDSRPDNGDDQVDIVAVFAQHGANRKQHVLHVFGVGLVELVDQLVRRFAEQLRVFADGLRALRKQARSGAGCQPLQQASSFIVCGHYVSSGE